MPDMLRLAAIAVAAALCAAVVRKGAAELGLVLAIVAGAILLSASLEALSSVWALMVKTTGIAILTRLAAELCRDAKESGIAAFVETAGAACALCAALPLLETVLDMVTGLL